jgi:hypothetical protein
VRVSAPPEKLRPDDRAAQQGRRDSHDRTPDPGLSAIASWCCWYTLFITALGIWSLRNTPLDALPDLSDTQVISEPSFPGQAPQL